MQKQDNNMKKSYILIAVLAIFASLLRCFFSIDVDEKYTTLCSVRVAMGYTLFGDMWESPQTSAMFIAPFLKLWNSVTGSLDGVVLFDRIITVIFTLIVSFVVFCTIKKFYSVKAGVWCALVSFCTLPRGTLSAEYGLLQANFVFLAICGMMCLLKEELSRNRRMVLCILTGIAWSMAVLCYPSFLFCTIFFLGGLWIKRKTMKENSLLISLTCIVCAVLFMLFVFAHTSFGAFGEALSAVSGHGSIIRESYYRQMPEIFVKLCIVFLAALIFIGMIEWIHFIVKKKWIGKDSCKLLFLVSPFAAYSIILVGGNATKIYVTGCYGVAVAFAFFEIIAILGAGVVQDSYIRWLNFLSITVYLATVVQGDLGPKDYFNFLYLSVLTVLLEIDSYSRANGFSERKIFLLSEGTILFCIILLIYVKGCCVRIDGVGYSTIFEERSLCTKGPLAGIYLYPEDVIKSEEKSGEISRYTEAYDNILVVSSDNLECAYSKGKFVYATYCGLQMSMLDSSVWIDYLESSYHDKITKVFLDKDYFEDEQKFFETKLGQYISEKMKIISIDEKKRYYVMDVG